MVYVFVGQHFVTLKDSRLRLLSDYLKWAESVFLYEQPDQSKY